MPERKFGGDVCGRHAMMQAHCGVCADSGRRAEHLMP